MLAYLLRSFDKLWDSGLEVETVAAWIQKTCKPLLPSRKECQRAARLLLRWSTA
jgi:hypothetical protein